VDSGSVAGLTHGAGLPVRLDPATPREAQLAGGTRRFVEANRYHFLVPVIGFGILGTLAGLTYRWRRRKRQTSSAQTTSPEVSVMNRTSRDSSARLILALAAGLAACGEGAAEQPRRATGSGAPPCPTIADIETAIGFPVKAVPVPVDGCLYQLTGRYQGVSVSLLYQPATRANDVFAEVKKRTQLASGKEPNRLTLGDSGWASSREAAVVSQGRLYYVEMSYGAFSKSAFREDAPVRVAELAIRTAPGSKHAASGGTGNSAASLDACTLATNAEVSEIAEERPEIAKFWSPPTASFGGSHCDYDGGSIRVYQGKSPAAALEATLKEFKEPRAPVQGIGDKAFFMIPYPDDKYKRLGLLALYAGPRVVQLTLDAQGDEPLTATRPRLERLARLVLPRLR
jgi:hypothetical protein